MQTSAQGVATLEHHEGVVLRAYRCPAGIWTIGAGVTAASGVVKPKAGMVISKAEATRLLQLALRQNYEPAVKAAMPGARQHEFDAGVSFHFNTGAIGRATWVKIWPNIGKRRGADPDDVRRALLAWNKGGGKVLPGLVRRREDEARMLLQGKYPVQRREAVADGRAVWALPMSITEKANVGAELQRLGYQPYGLNLKGEWIGVEAVKSFQRDHGLTVDGIIGRATLSTLQRRLDAATKAKPAAAAPALAATAPAGEASGLIGLPGGADWIILAAATAFALWVAFQYRDAIAAKVSSRMPRLAALLRSF